MLVVRARLDFHKAVSPFFESDNVRLAEGGRIIAFENFISALFEIFYGEFFSGSSKKFFTKVFLWILHIPLSLITLMCSAVP